MNNLGLEFAFATELVGSLYHHINFDLKTANYRINWFMSVTVPTYRAIVRYLEHLICYYGRAMNIGILYFNMFT